MAQHKTVYIAYTGGTIGMQRTADGYRPEAGFLETQMQQIPVLKRTGMPAYEIHEYQPLLDSSNMTPAHWADIGRDIYARYDQFDGFIVLHGTDTMAFSASALSFMFEDLSKPIIFTGSQVPLREIRSDGHENLITSLLIASQFAVPEVCLFVGNRLLRGNRATKMSANSFRAFSSPNYPPLGIAGVEIEIHRSEMQPLPEQRVKFHPAMGAQVADIRLFPGISAQTLRQFLQPPLQGAVLHTYGVGNAPDRADFLAALKEATDRGVVIINCSQCLHGTVNMEDYATGHSLREAGVISGYDMTAEAALTKLYYLISRGLPVDQIRHLAQQDLRGELTRPEERRRRSSPLEDPITLDVGT